MHDDLKHSYRSATKEFSCVVCNITIELNELHYKFKDKEYCKFCACTVLGVPMREKFFIKEKDWNGFYGSCPD